ncbi:DegV domain-containing protein [Mycobacteroides abscessus subsp. abscessus]|nr:DegV domain-containing protein [Mycobacteroides abscessus subsp. abscessus]
MVVHKLDHLRRSGRISATSSWLGTALALKPVLQIDEEGKLVLAQRVRTATKAIGAMVDNIVEFVGERRVSNCRSHAGPGRCRFLASRHGTRAAAPASGTRRARVRQR